MRLGKWYELLNIHRLENRSSASSRSTSGHPQPGPEILLPMPVSQAVTAPHPQKHTEVLCGLFFSFPRTAYPHWNAKRYACVSTEYSYFFLVFFTAWPLTISDTISVTIIVLEMFSQFVGQLARISASCSRSLDDNMIVVLMVKLDRNEACWKVKSTMF